MDAPSPDYIGHRSRLRARLIAGGGDSLLDHELIEYLLMLAVPRRDTKTLAKRLLAEFGGMAELLAADAGSIARVKDAGDSVVAAIKIAQAVALRVLQAEASAQPVLANWQALIDYLTARLAHQTIESVRVLHLNTRNILIRDEEMSRGSIDESAVYVREVIRRAIELGSAALILVHNHPSGDPAPSRADIEITRNVIEAGKRMGIAVHDHLIIGRGGHASLRSMGLI
ncbi:DNA repair protein RadC [Hephaestia sp. GCM10023244]|uniref:RadC family protein n=1 Tax=unclassified Hephaestia TaxID=2631281 RepID=UPI0020770006|nr:DNA repair protein RadC [Hephaestia sp. MAHUQ-44]MCM8729599.1 DNA repair protein RadC [Hephaestia sp. MAHUQ-44]